MHECGVCGRGFSDGVVEVALPEPGKHAPDRFFGFVGHFGDAGLAVDS